MNTRRSGGGNEHSFAEVKPDLYPINAKICQLVEQFPCMYNRSHPHYLKKEVVEKAWVKIAKEMNESISLCKERWRNIRTSFARSINVRKVPASANRTKPYYLHEELKFLTHHITPGVPVPRRVLSKKRLHSRTSTIGEDEAESEEIKVSMSEESFDSFAALMPDQNGDDDEENDEDDSVVNSDEHEKSRLQAADVLNADSNIDDTTSDGEQQDSHLGIEYQMSVSDTQQPAAPPATVAIEVAPIVLPNVCPCPPKKRQRLMEHFEDAVSTSMGDNEAKIQVNTIQPLQQQQQQQQQTQDATRATASSNTSGSDVDFDDAFLQGIRPEMKAMTFQQKVYFKRRIYELLGEIFPLTSILSAANTAAAPAALNESGEMLRRLNSLLAPTLANPPTIALPIAYSTPTNGSNNTSANVTVSPVLMPPRLRAVGRPNHATVAAPNTAQRTAPQLVVGVPKPTATTFQPLSALLSAANGPPFLKQELPDHSDN